MNDNVYQNSASVLDTVSARQELPAESASDWPLLFDRLGRHATRYGLVLVMVWIGAMKFTAYEAAGIAPFVTHSPLLSWVYGILGYEQFSTVLGVVEIVMAILLATGVRWPRLALIGAMGAVGMFLTTLSFMVTTPGVFEPAAGGFPALSAMPGQFLVKDIVLLGISVQLLADAIKAARQDIHK